jgi:hypothetical protein
MTSRKQDTAMYPRAGYLFEGIESLVTVTSFVVSFVFLIQLKI